MKKFFSKKVLYMALAATMVSGGISLAFAAATGQTGQMQTVEAATDDTVITPSINSFTITEEYSYIKVNASVTGESADLYVNDVKYKTYTPAWWSDDNTINIGDTVTWYKKAGATYNIKVVANGTNDTASETKTVTTEYPAFDSTDMSFIEQTAVSDMGYKTPGDMYIYMYTAEAAQYGRYGTYGYELYRSTSSKSKGEKVASGEVSPTTSKYLSCTDTTATPGKTYYYTMDLVSLTDEYNKTSRILATKKGQYEYDLTTNFYVSVGTKGVDIQMSSYKFANQFVIYRSTNKNKGFKKLKTIYTTEYTDTTAKSGKTYWYKVKPKYYDATTGKTYTGSISEEAKGVKMFLGYIDGNNFELKQTSETAVKASWNKVGGAAYYEVWCRNLSVAGDAYQKVGTTTKTSYTVKNLKNGCYYYIKIKAVANNKTMNTYNDSITVGYKQSSTSSSYSAYVRNMKVKNITSKLSSDKKTLTVTTTLIWDRVWGASGYYVYAKNVKNGKYAKVATLKASATSYKFKNTATADDGAKYSTVKVLPYKGKKIGANYSSTVYVNYMPFAKNVKVARKSTANKITWSAVAGASAYEVYRISEFGGTQQIAVTKDRSYTDKNVTPGMEYTYYIKCETEFPSVYTSYNSTYNYDSSIDKNAAGFKKLTGCKTYVQKVGTPKISKASNSAKKTAKITWKKVSGAKYYLVYRATSKNGKYTKVKKTTSLSYTNNKLKKGKTYYYKVKAVTVNGSGTTVQSAYSKVKGVKIKK